MRHRLGLSHIPPGAPVVACDCAERPAPADHAMFCYARMKGMTMRHDLLLGAWHRTAHRAGTGSASLKCGDMRVVLPDEGLVVTDVSVVHPAANTFFQRAAHAAGAAASLRDGSKFRKYGGGGQVAGGSFTPSPSSREGAYAGQRCSSCKPLPPLLPPL
jgi:hypothetical protein